MDKLTKYELDNEIEEEIDELNTDELPENDIGLTIEEQRAKVDLINLKIKKLLRERDEVEREIENLKDDMEGNVE